MIRQEKLQISRKRWMIILKNDNRLFLSCILCSWLWCLCYDTTSSGDYCEGYPSFVSNLGSNMGTIFVAGAIMKANMMRNNNKMKQNMMRAQMKKSKPKRKKREKDSLINDVPDATTQAIVPLHLHHGTLNVYLYVGSPAQRQILIVDTGSRYMSFPCSPFCKGVETCGKHVSDEYFNLNISTTYQMRIEGECFSNTQTKTSTYKDHSQITEDDYCNMKQMYLEGSFWDAYEVEDIVWFGTNDLDESMEIMVPLAAPYTFGCQKDVQGLFMKQYADGILGLTRHETNFVRRLHEDHDVIKRNAFSICVSSTEQGSLSLGGSLPTVLYHNFQEPMKFTDLISDEGLWGVEVQVVHVGTICITCDAKNKEEILDEMNANRGTIFDTGTTDTYLTEILSKPFIDAWLECTGQDPKDHSFLKREKRYSYEEFQKFCSVSITFTANVTLTIEPQNFMEDTSNKNLPKILRNSDGLLLPWEGKRKFFNRLYLNEERGAVLGVSAMVGYDILYDEQGGQIGIAKATCPTYDET